MEINIVTNSGIINIIKKSKYFTVSLGYVSTVDSNGSRKLNDKDKFSYFYNSLYESTIYGQGRIGNISFYSDPYILEDLLAVYMGDSSEEFIFEFDRSILNSKGVDFYLGHILKETEFKYEERSKENALKKEEKIEKGDPNRISNNPGAVSYEDVKAYIEEQRKNRQL